jgi:hypothetical protein
MSAHKNPSKESVLDIYFSTAPYKVLSAKHGLAVGTISKIKRRMIHRAVTGVEIMNASLITYAFTGAV